VSYKTILVLLVVCLLLPGCNGYKDIDKRFFVVEIGIDQAENEEKKYLVTLKLAIPSANPKTTGSESVVLTEEGKTISEAVRVLKAKVDKELDFGHAKVIIIGEEIAEEGISELLDWFTRRRDIQQIAYVGIGKPDAKTIVEKNPKFVRIPGNYLFLTFGDTGTETPYVTTSYLFHLRRCIEEDGLDAILPIIETKKDTFAIDNAGVFQDGKLAIELTEEETMLYNAIETEYPKVELIIETDEFIFGVSSKILKAKYKIFTPQEKKPYIEMSVDIEGIVEETTEPIKEELLKKYEKLVKDDTEEKIKSLLVKLQKESVDPFGFGLRYRATHVGKEEEKLEKWKAIYPEIEFNVKVKVKLMGTGVIE
jgi:spore germination protein KC